MIPDTNCHSHSRSTTNLGMTSVDGVVLYKARIIIPPSLRQDVLSVLHSVHQGVTSMTSCAEATVFWPGITPAIMALRTGCNDCNHMAPSQPSAPSTRTVPPAYPIQCVWADFCHNKGVNYLVVVDRYSNWPIIEQAHDGAKGLINSLRRIFVTYSIPDQCASNGGPEFISTSLTTLAHTVSWTPTPCSVPYSNTATHQTQTGS